jgi:phosphotransferase system enzyme I (PtsI)
VRAVRGVAVTGGYGLGPAFYVASRAPRVSERKIAPGEVRQEVQRFNRALNRARQDLEDIRRRGLRRLEGRVIEIFDAQLMMLDDSELYRQVSQAIRNENTSADWAYYCQVESALAVLRKSKDKYLRQMEGDIEAVSRRVIQYLQGLKQATFAELTVPSVLLADRLSPADLVQLPRDNVLAIVTCSGSRTDHTSLVARSLGIPAVVGARGDLQPERKGQRVLVDAEEGRVFFSPGRNEMAVYREYMHRQIEARRQARTLVDKKACTSDGHRVVLMANLELVQEAQHAIDCGAEGVGLFRSEFLFISSERLPDEEKQLAAYSQLASQFAPHTVTLRVYDLGGDKVFYAHRPEYEPNPAMGWRAVRLLMDRPAMFRTQLRAMFRAAAATGNVRIMFPMVSSLEEWDRILTFTHKVRAELEQEGLQFPARVPLGVMIEVPALALEADRLTTACDFFSVGTNDLVQYLLAVDRQNPQVADRYQPFHPAVLRIMKSVVQAAHEHGLPVSICGDMASDLRSLPVLVGLGFDELSTVPAAIPQIKAVLGDFSREEARTLVEDALAERTPGAITALVNRRWQRWSRRAGQKGNA